MEILENINLKLLKLIITDIKIIKKIKLNINIKFFIINM